MIAFNDLVLLGFGLRILLVVIGAMVSIKIIGFKNIQFLIQYIKRRAFNSHRLFFWFVAFGSLFYFEHLVSNANNIALSEVFVKNWILSLLVLFLLFGVISYAFLETKNSIRTAEEIKKSCESGQFWKNILDKVSDVSWFIPGIGIWAKIGVFGASKAVHRFLDNHIEDKVTTNISQTVKVMLMIVSVNLCIILVSTYLITDKIILW